MSLYSHMQMPLFHVNTRLAFPTGVAPNGRFFCFSKLDYNVIRNAVLSDKEV